MCVASPGKIIEINGDTAVVDYSGNKTNAALGIVDAKIGDWVLVHAGLVIQVLLMMRRNICASFSTTLNN